MQALSCLLGAAADKRILQLIICQPFGELQIYLKEPVIELLAVIQYILVVISVISVIARRQLAAGILLHLLRFDDYGHKIFRFGFAYRLHAADKAREIIRRRLCRIAISAFVGEHVLQACRLVEKLGLHYQLSKLAAGDCSASMATTYDIELWIPSMNEYKECSSVSNANDYQARRGNIRFRRADTKKIEYVHTLNGSGLATSRLMPAIVEQYQQADGSVIIPEALRPFMGGREKIEPVR